jgi:hypothetical protein
MTATRVEARAYTSPTLVLLAMDWPDGGTTPDFLGFAILRKPGLIPGGNPAYLLNKIGFSDSGPGPYTSDKAPIQKFLWWDPAIDKGNRGKTIEYTVTPVRGHGKDSLTLVHAAERKISVKIPQIETDGISTWFNRAVVSSQAFKREFPHPSQDLAGAMDWLANGLGDAFDAFLVGSPDIAGAIYHLTDKKWVLPALEGVGGNLSLVYEDRSNDRVDRPAVQTLTADLPKFRGHPRGKTNIMHDKFLVDLKRGRVLMGSANFTPEAITSQANLLHIFNSSALATLFAARHDRLAGVPEPTIAETAEGAAWSAPVQVGAASIRVFFSPEPKGKRVSIDTVVKAVKEAKSSVVFCMFDPTDPPLLKALLATGDQGKLLYGMLNSITDPTKSAAAQKATATTGEPPAKPSPSTEVQVTLFNRSQADRKVLPYNYFRPGKAPKDFLPELSTIDTSKFSTAPPPTAGHKPPAVHIHHKFIVIDGETSSPTIYTGSANLSKNSTNNNDENLLEIKGSVALAQTYFAEFTRIYQHYRARALWNMAHPPGGAAAPAAAPEALPAFNLRKDNTWTKDAYVVGKPGYLERTKLAHP